MFNQAVQTKIENLIKNPGDTSHAVYDALIFSKIRKILGGRVKLLICGGAPLAQEVKHFMMAAFSCAVWDVYGITETSGAICSTCNWEVKAGIVGGPLPCVKIKLMDVPELGYLTTDNPPRGEVMVKGNSVFSGYFR
jgi:long-chain acyl-CoA synthetase